MARTAPHARHATTRLRERRITDRFLSAPGDERALRADMVAADGAHIIKGDGSISPV
jgi:hypothetical protein